jgi:peptidoglycan/xylan/chitin deacetylase (PgdA/CDA1 family)
MEYHPDQTKNATFLKKIRDFMGSNSTYFIPGNLASPLASCLRDVERDNEIGLHGHHHELWREANFVSKKPIRDKDKRKLIVDSISEFDTHGLKRPFSFRAPYMWCKKSDMRLLKSMDFKVDSSDNPQVGANCMRVNGQITKVPVTTNPFPYYNKRRGLVYAKFNLLNMKLLHDYSEHEIYRYIDQILKLQAYQELVPHLVFLGHSWEFYRGKEKGWGDSFEHRGDKNYQILRDKLDLLEKKYTVRYVTLSEFGGIFEKHNKRS